MGARLVNSFSIVKYVDGPLAAFVNSLRGEFTPGCPHRAHLTLLPPRPLAAPVDEAIEEAARIVARFHPFDVEVGSVGGFAESSVVKLEILRGQAELVTLHDILNTGHFRHAETFPYVPHITLCMDFAPERRGEILRRARDTWREFGGLARLRVDELTVVQQRDDERWTDLVDLPIGEYHPVRARR